MSSQRSSWGLTTGELCFYGERNRDVGRAVSRGTLLPDRGCNRFTGSVL